MSGPLRETRREELLQMLPLYDIIAISSIICYNKKIYNTLMIIFKMKREIFIPDDEKPVIEEYYIFFRDGRLA